MEVVDANTVACTAPYVSPLTPGYPQVEVRVVASSGISAPAPLHVLYSSPFTVVWATPPPAATALLPSGRSTGMLLRWPVVPTLEVTGVGAGSCWLVLAVNGSGSGSSGGGGAVGDDGGYRRLPGAAAAERNRSWVAPDAMGAESLQSQGLVGTTVARVQLDASTPVASLGFDAVGVVGASGLAATLSGACLDDRGQSSTTGAVEWSIGVPTLAAAWEAASVTLLGLPVAPAALPALAASLAWVGINGSTAVAADMVRQASCTAAIYNATAGTPAAESLAAFLARTAAQVWSTSSGEVGGGKCSAGALSALPPAAPAACLRVAFADLSLAAVPLATTVALAAECVWVPTSERVRLPALVARTVNADIAWELPPGGTRSLIVDPPIAVPAALHTNAPPAVWSGANATCWLQSYGGGYAQLVPAAVQATYTVAPGGALVPAVVVGISGEPGASLTAALQCRVWGLITTTLPVRLLVRTLSWQPVAPLPTSFLPSDGGSRAALLALFPPPAFRLLDSEGAPVTDAVCSLAAVGNGVEVRRAAGSGRSGQAGEYTLVPDERGVVNMSAAVVVASFSTTAVVLTAACTRPVPDAPEPIQWSLSTVRLALAVCTPPPVMTDAASRLPAWQVTIAVVDEDGGQGPCSALRPPFPPAARSLVACSASAVNDPESDVASLIIQGGDVTGVGGDGTATFESTQLIGTRGAEYNVSVACALGSVPIPGVFTFRASLLTCPSGYAPSGVFCSACAEGTYTRGVNERACLPCPADGATCERGILRLKPNFYRAEAERGEPVGPSSRLLPCFNTEACLFNASTEAYACARGYTGPLCGVCDASAGYGMFDTVCRRCWSSTATWLLLAGVVGAFVAFMALLSLSAWMQMHDDSSIALKQVIGYVQAVSSLSVFTAGSAELFRSAFGWTEYASESPFSLGALQCQLQWSLLPRYAATVVLPGVGVACATAAVALVLAVRALSFSRARRPCAFNVAAWRAGMTAWVEERRHMATLVFLAFSCYMPIVSASFNVLTCGATPVDGAYWLATDLSVRCYTGEHAATMAFAIVVLVLVGLGTPALILRLLGRVSHVTLREPAFINAYAFLYQGYARAGDMTTRRATLIATLKAQGALALLPPKTRWRAPTCLRGCGRSLLWWEAAVMLRKAGIVMLATVVTDKFYQVVAAVLLFAGCMALQQHFTPYAASAFNTLELLSLVDLYVTAAVCTVMLPATAVPANVVRTPPPWETGLTALLVIINAATLVILVLALVLQTAACARRSATTALAAYLPTAKHGSAAAPAFPTRDRRGGATFKRSASVTAAVPPSRPPPLPAPPRVVAHVRRHPLATFHDMPAPVPVLSSVPATGAAAPAVPPV